MRSYIKFWNAILVSGMMALTGCTWTQVQVTTTVVKVGVDVDKKDSPNIRGRGDIDLDGVSQILKALPDVPEIDAEEYLKGAGGDQ